MAKFCNQCGRRLEDGEICSCQQQTKTVLEKNNTDIPNENQMITHSDVSFQTQTGSTEPPSTSTGNKQEAEWFNKQKKVLVSGTKSIFAEIFPILRAPVSRVREISSVENGKLGRELILAKAIVFVIVVLGAMFLVSDRLSSLSYGFVEPEMPYLKVLVAIFIMTAGVDILEAVVLKSITNAFGGTTTTNTMMAVVGARGIYDTILLLAGIIFGMMAAEVALIFFALCYSISNFMEMGIYLGNVQLNEDKRPYAFFVAKLCMTLIMGLAAYLLVRNLMDSALGSMLGQFI